MRIKRILASIAIFTVVATSFLGCSDINLAGINGCMSHISDNSIPLSGQLPDAYIPINNNQPGFSAEEKARLDAFEVYSPLDSLGRCGVCFANVCDELQPTQERGEIGMIKPSGWHTVKYNEIIDGNYLYNRCHLIGYQLTGENANEKNLITGTRFMNVNGMLPFENMVDDYLERTNNHVLYRVTPDFHDFELVARGVQIEAWSVEDNGAGICFNVYCENIQPGIIIDYSNGESSVDNDYQGVNTQQMAQPMQASPDVNAAVTNTIPGVVWLPHSGKCYHSKNDCGTMNPARATGVSEAEAIMRGYRKCPNCW